MASARFRKSAESAEDHAKLNAQALAMHPKRRRNAFDIVKLILDGARCSTVRRDGWIRHRRGNDGINIAGAYAISLNRNLTGITGRLRTSARHIDIDLGNCLLPCAGRSNTEADRPLRFIHVNHGTIAARRAETWCPRPRIFRDFCSDAPGILCLAVRVSPIRQEIFDEPMSSAATIAALCQSNRSPSPLIFHAIARPLITRALPRPGHPLWLSFTFAFSAVFSSILAIATITRPGSAMTLFTPFEASAGLHQAPQREPMPPSHLSGNRTVTPLSR